MSLTQIVQDVRTSLARKVDAEARQMDAQNPLLNGDHPDRDAQRAQVLVHVAPHDIDQPQHTAAGPVQGPPWDAVA